MADNSSSKKNDRPLLSDEAFQNDHSRKLFEAIDELRSCGANRDIDLPELVIVGDQSAGKSSLLQSLTDIPFPVAGRLCTRFPTRIVSRRTPTAPDATKISIEATPLDSLSIEALDLRKDRYAGFSRVSSTITAEEFKAAIDEASDLMGIAQEASAEAGPTAPKPSGKNFSGDILKIEISGPGRSHFSILDVPGVFQSLTQDLTKEEKEGVTRMVSWFMTPKQSVIICVASGANDLANQAVFDMASLQDPKGERTIGVITKCDVTQHAEQVMRIAENKEKRLKLGWFVVRNRTPSEVEKYMSAAERDTKELELFESEPWATLPVTRRGTQALKKYLAELLCARILDGFPVLIQDINTRLTDAVMELESMGLARKTLEQKRTYLTGIAQSLNSLANQGLRGRYEFITDVDMKLRLKVREANEAFAVQMKQKGHSVPFVDPPNSGNERRRRSGHQVDTHHKQPGQVYLLIREEVMSSKGTELQGTLNPDVLPVLFHKQARNWRPIAEAHFASIQNRIGHAMTQILALACTDVDTRKKIASLLRQSNEQEGPRRFQELSDHVENILSKHLQTSNGAFEEKITEARKKRFGAALQRYRRSRLPEIKSYSKKDGNLEPDDFDDGESGSDEAEDQNYSGKLVIDMQDTASLFAELHISNAQNLEDEIHDTLKAYYEVERERYIDYVTRIIVEPYLTDPRGPVLCFSPLYIAGLSDKEVEDLGAEDDSLVRIRAMREEDLVRLNRAKNIATRAMAL